jgi:hypothetical protein
LDLLLWGDVSFFLNYIPLASLWQFLYSGRLFQLPKCAENYILYYKINLQTIAVTSSAFCLITTATIQPKPKPQKGRSSPLKWEFNMRKRIRKEIYAKSILHVIIFKSHKLLMTPKIMMKIKTEMTKGRINLKKLRWKISK